MIMTTYQELLGTYIKSKQAAYTYTECTETASGNSPNCFGTFNSSAFQERNVFPDIYNYLIVPHKCEHINKC